MHWFMSSCPNEDISNNVILAFKLSKLSRLHIMCHGTIIKVSCQCVTQVNNPKPNPNHSSIVSACS